MQAAAPAFVNYITKDETTDIIGDATYPTEGELAAILRGIQTSNATATKFRLFTHSKETVGVRQTRSTTNTAARVIEKEIKEIHTSVRN